MIGLAASPPCAAAAEPWRWPWRQRRWPAAPARRWSNALTPQERLHDRARSSYGPNARQRLDLYVPDGAADDAPVLVFFYGGNWQSGSKELLPLRRPGLRLAGLRHRDPGLSRSTPRPATRPSSRMGRWRSNWLEAQPATAGARQVFLAGHSAGAYIAAMLALDRRWLGDGRCRPGLPADRGDGRPRRALRLPAAAATPRSRRSSAPGRRARPRSRSTMWRPATRRCCWRPAPTTAPSARATASPWPSGWTAAGVAAELIEYPGLGHIGIVAALAAPLRFVAPVLDDVDAFLRRQPGCALG